MIIICIGFGLAYVIEYLGFDTTRIQPTNMNTTHQHELPPLLVIDCVHSSALSAQIPLMSFTKLSKNSL